MGQLYATAIQKPASWAPWPFILFYSLAADSMEHTYAQLTGNPRLSVCFPEKQNQPSFSLQLTLFPPSNVSFLLTARGPVLGSARRRWMVRRIRVKSSIFSASYSFFLLVEFNVFHTLNGVQAGPFRPFLCIHIVWRRQLEELLGTVIHWCYCPRSFLKVPSKFQKNISASGVQSVRKSLMISKKKKKPMLSLDIISSTTDRRGIDGDTHRGWHKESSL